LVLESIKTKVLIKVDNPKLVFAKIANSILSRKQKYGFHSTSVIHPDAKIHRNCYIGPHAYIGRAVIGEGTIIYGNCYIYDNVSIGKRVIIDAGCVIGSEGFGFVRDEDGIPVRFPQIGGVLIEDDVEIGANSCIDRGALNNTIIHQGVKIDKLVHIAHNVEIGKYSFIISNSVIAGSSRIGDFCWISPTTTVINKVNIGNRSVIGIGSVVTKNVPDDQTWMGNPAAPIDKFIKTLNKLKTL
jgi:UDP-3-O-[3-hydroxymyristoyl] glucosamine N-acyltransferase